MSDIADKLVAASLWGKVLYGSLDDPQWGSAGRVHDWRNYVPDEVRQVWGELDATARAVAFLLASRAAEDEDWD